MASQAEGVAVLLAGVVRAPLTVVPRVSGVPVLVTGVLPWN